MMMLIIKVIIIKSLFNENNMFSSNVNLFLWPLVRIKLLKTVGCSLQYFLQLEEQTTELCISVGAEAETGLCISVGAEAETGLCISVGAEAAWDARSTPN